jgi:hypothetical protein
MDYQKIYNQIIERAKNRMLKGYKEKHHIIPKCLGGFNNKENFVELTAREHFLCHMLLCEIYPNENKLKHALFLMAIGKQKIKEKTYVIGSRIYERLKSEYSQMLTGKKQSKEIRNKKSQSMKGHSMYTEEWKQKISKSNTGRKITWGDKISLSLKGRKIDWDRGVNKFVLQYDKEGNFIKEHSSINEAERKVKGDIGAMLAGKQKTAGGYVWKFKKN